MSSHAERLAAGLVDRYRVERKLGEGGMATVYLAEDLRHRRRVAIKMVHPELSAVLGSERFLKEIELTASLQHPHILPLFDSGAAEGLLYYVMPYIEGESLRARMERERPLPVQDAVRITKQVAQALDYAHRHGIVHRDIKPENILLHEDSALVADFGIALAVQSAGGSRLTQTGLSLGTPQYMSPEQAMGERHVDARTDIYALGAVAYEMLAGEPPFTGGTAQAIVAKVITEKPAPLSSHRDTVPAHVAAAVHVALSKLAADRWASARDFATALEEGGRVTMPVAGRSTVALSTPQPARLGRFAALGAVAAATLALGAVLGRGIGAHPMPGGQLIYLDANGVLYRVRFDAQRGRLEGAPEPVADQVRMPIGGVIVFAASRSGDIAYRASPAVNGIRRSLIRVDRAGHVLPLPLPIDAYSSFRVSPDGRRMVLEQTVEGADGGNIFVLSIGDSVMRPFARTGISNYPVWSPDGRRVAWSRLLDGERDIVWQDVDGADSARVMLRRPGEQWQVEFVPGTDRALVREGNATGGPQNLDIVGFRPGSDSVFPFAVRPNVLERAPRASPDGRWVAYVSNETGRDEVFVRRFPGGPAVQVSDGGGAEPVWARERRELFYKGNDDFIAAQFGPGSPFTTVARRKLFSVKRGFFNNPWAARYDVLPGDSTFLMLDPGDDASQADVRTILIQHPAFLADR